MLNLQKITYHEPHTLVEACALLEDHCEQAMILNGGTDVVVRLNSDIYRPQMINIKYIPNLDYIREGEDGLQIGALTKLSTIEKSPLVAKHFPVLVKAVASIGTPQIRNLGTLSGNLCNASPVADSAPALLVLGAQLKVDYSSGSRKIPLAGFHSGPGKSILDHGELLTQVIIPYSKPGFYADFGKHGPRKAADIAVVNAAVGLEFAGETCTSAIVALGAVAPTLIRATKTEAALVGKKKAEIDAPALGALAAEEARPITDVRGSQAYRKEIVAVLVERALLPLQA